MKNPRRLAPAGVGKLACCCLSDPRRRVRNDAYYDDASNYQRAGENGQSGKFASMHGRVDGGD